MYLKRLKLHNFKCFEDLDMEFHDNLTVIVGSNGAGKTTILEGAAIAVSSLFVKMDGLTGRKIDRTQAHLKSYSVGSTKDVQEQYPVVVSAIAKDNQFLSGEGIEWTRSLSSSTGQTLFGDAKDITSLGVELQQKVRNGDTKILLPLFAYYGTGRLWDYHREKQSDVFETNNRLNGYLNCMDGTANIKLMMNWFLKMTVQKYQNQELNLGDIPELEAVYSAMETCYRRITGCDYVKMQYNMGTKALDVAYKDASGNIMRMPINQLSDGYKSTISLVADIAYRMAVLNPQLLGSVCSQTDGIVLIDEVDLHLHPEWQQQILADLTAIFPKVQFIVTTHAPAVISSVEQECVRVLHNNQIDLPALETYGRDTNGILRAVMGVSERQPKTMEQFSNFYKLIDSGDMEKAEQLLAELEEQYPDDPEVGAMRVQLDLEQI